MSTTHDSTVAPVSLALREQTTMHHHRAERSAFQRRLVRGAISRAEYVSWLQQLHRVHSELDAVAGGAALTVSERTLFHPSRSRVVGIERDLVHFGAQPFPHSAVAATESFCSRLRAWGIASPASLAGVLYVLEGSMNGARYIARALRVAFELDGDDGVASLDPYGERQTEEWTAFKTQLDACAEPSRVTQMVAAARDTFDAVHDIGAELEPGAG